MTTQDNCLHQNFRWVDGPNTFECESCLRPLPPAKNVCHACGEAVDNHKHISTGPVSFLTDRARRIHATS